MVWSLPRDRGQSAGTAATATVDEFFKPFESVVQHLRELKNQQAAASCSIQAWT